MKNKLKIISIVAILSGIFGLFQNCGGGAVFKSTNSSRNILVNTETEVVEVGGVNGLSKKLKTYTFDRETKQGVSPYDNLDVLWVVDNSGSMSEEAEHVRNNLLSFMNTLENSTSTHVTLLSRITSNRTPVNAQDRQALEKYNSTAVNFPQGYDQNKHSYLNTQILSYNALSMIVTLQELLITSTDSRQAIFRDDSEKVIIVVSDDNSWVSVDEFYKGLDYFGFPKDDMTFYSFIGFGEEESPCQAATGSVYKELSAETGGKSFNICEQDWGQHFSDLIDDIILTIADSKFDVGIQDPSSVKVYVNDEEISEFTVSNTRVSIDPELFSAVNKYSIKITHEVYE
jgi:hypothetical protein